MRKILFFLPLLVLFACSSDDEEPVEILPQEEVHIMFSTASFGDHAYNDMILYGIQKSCALHRFNLIFHQPQKVEEGWKMYQDWQNKPSSDHKELFIIASHEYEDSLLYYPPAVQKNRETVLFEATHEIENMASFNMETYGAAYYLGVLVGNTVPSAAVLLANEETDNIKNCSKGFKAGYLETNPDYEFGELYLSKKKGEGFNQPDIAYRMSSMMFRNFQFIFPVAGGSNMGVYRYCRENYKGIFTAGIDGDMNKYTNNMIGSLVKRLDLVLEDYIQRWLKDEPLRGYTNFGLASGYVDLVVAPNFEEFYAPFINGLKEKAIEKENEYLEQH